MISPQENRAKVRERFEIRFYLFYRREYAGPCVALAAYQRIWIACLFVLPSFCIPMKKFA